MRLAEVGVGKSGGASWGSHVAQRFSPTNNPGLSPIPVEAYGFDTMPLCTPRLRSHGTSEVLDLPEGHKHKRSRNYNPQS